MLCYLVHSKKGLEYIKNHTGFSRGRSDPWHRLLERIWGAEKGKHLAQQRWLNVCEIWICVCVRHSLTFKQNLEAFQGNEWKYKHQVGFVRKLTEKNKKENSQFCEVENSVFSKYQG